MNSNNNGYNMNQMMSQPGMNYNQLLPPGMSSDVPNQAMMDVGVKLASNSGVQILIGVIFAIIAIIIVVLIFTFMNSKQNAESSVSGSTSTKCGS